MKHPSHESEARALLDAHVETLRERGWDALRPLAGRIARSYLGGRLQMVADDDAEFSEVRGSSGVPYQLMPSASWWEGEGSDLTIEAKIQEDAPPFGSLYSSFVLAPDGTFTLEY